MKKKKKITFPSAYSILLTLTLLIGILTQFVPGVMPAKLSDVVIAPVNGMIGVRDGDIHSKVQTAMKEDGTMAALEVLRTSPNPYINYYNSGTLTGAIDVALCTLIIGGFLGIINKTGVLDSAISAIVLKLKGKEIYIIPVIMFLFSIGGTAWGMCEDSLPFYVIVTTAIIMAGFDSLVAVATMILGAGCGVLGSTINPFCIGAAVAGAKAVGVDINQGTIIAICIVLWIVTLLISMYFVMKYAKAVKTNPSNSLMGEQERNNAKSHFIKDTNQEDLEFTPKRKICLFLFGFSFLIMVMGVVPWQDFGITFFKDYTGFLTGSYLGSWYFNEIGVWFMVMSIVVGVVYGLSESELISSFMKGAEEMIGVALIIAVSRGVSFVMTNSGLDLFFLDKAVGVLNGVSGIVFINITYLIFMGLSFLIPSTSGLASVTMPIFAPLAQRLGISPELVISAFSAGSGILNLVTPTSGVIMGGLAIARVEYSTWLKFVPKVLVCIFIASCIILSTAIMIL